MEADISCIEVIDDNKENIPPNSSLKEIVLQFQDCKLPAANGRKFKRKFRSPLTEDITNLLVLGQSDLGLHSSAALNCRKRKALAAAPDDHIDIDWKQKISSKILRTGFR